MWTSNTVKQKTGSVHKTGTLASKQLFETVPLDNTSLDIMKNVPDFLASQSFQPFSDQCKNGKQEEFWICIFSSAALITLWLSETTL